MGTLAAPFAFAARSHGLHTSTSILSRTRPTPQSPARPHARTPVTINTSAASEPPHSTCVQQRTWSDRVCVVCVCACVWVRGGGGWGAQGRRGMNAPWARGGPAELALLLRGVSLPGAGAHHALADDLRVLGPVREALVEGVIQALPVPAGGGGGGGGGGSEEERRLSCRHCCLAAQASRRREAPNGWRRASGCRQAVAGSVDTRRPPESVRGSCVCRPRTGVFVCRNNRCE
jgi:hypothetical protein